MDLSLTYFVVSCRMMPEAVPVTMVPKNGTFVKNLRKRIHHLKKENSELHSDNHQLQQVDLNLALNSF